MTVRMAPSNTRMDVFVLAGGLDLSSSVLAIKPGAVTAAQNFEVSVDGGYRRTGGRQRFDGQPSPAGALCYTVAFDGTAPAAGTAISWPLGAGVAVASADGVLAFTKVSGPAPLAGDFIAPVGTATSDAVILGRPSTGAEKAFVLAAEQSYRDDVQAPPGSGAVLGAFRFQGVLYAFRNNAGASAANLWKSSPTGWEAVTTPALSPNGKYQTVRHVFQSIGDAVYGCDGVNKAWRFDGTTFTQITTGIGADNPQFIAAHMNHLFLSFGTNLANSAIGNPDDWQVINGAMQTAVPEDVTGLLPQVGSNTTGALAVACRNSVRMLYGTSSADWSLVILQPETGAVPYSSQNIGSAFMLDDIGVTQIGASQTFGNFAHSSLSLNVGPWLDERRNLLTCSSVSRRKNQYRMYFSDGWALYMTVFGRKLLGFMPIWLGVTVSCVASEEDQDGAERIWVGATDGMVYELDDSNNQDGAELSAWMILPFNHSKSPQLRKRYRRAVLEVSGASALSMRVDAAYGFDSGYTATSSGAVEAQGGRAFEWDVSNWDEAYWGGKQIDPVRIPLEGTAENMALSLYSSSATDENFTLRSVTLHYSPRRQER